MAPNINTKPNIHNTNTIRAASRNKQRSKASSSNHSTSSPFGSSTSASLASSLNSLFSPQPHAKDAALASLLATSSNPPVKLGGFGGTGLAAFGSFGGQHANSTVPRSLDEKLKERRNKHNASIPLSAFSDAASSVSAKAAADVAQSVASGSKTATKHSATKQLYRSQISTPHAPESCTKPTQKPIIPNVPPNRKPVFRPVLASSTAVSWPEMPVAGSKTVLHTLLETLSQPSIQDALHRDFGRRSRASPSTSKTNKLVQQGSSIQVDAQTGSNELAPVQMLAGINSITRAIEANIATDLEQLGIKPKDETNVVDVSANKIKVVFVCRHDVPNPSLVSHLPMLVTARNAVLSATTTTHLDNQAMDLASEDGGVLLFALPYGSEPVLAKALGLPHASTLALTTAFPNQLLKILLIAIQRETGCISQLRAEWLETVLRTARSFASTSSSLLLLGIGEEGLKGVTNLPTRIKLLRTTQVMDLNGCKANKRSKRKQRSLNWKKKKSSLQHRIKVLIAQLKYEKKKKKKKTPDSI